MSKVLTDSANYQAIASAIRAKGGASGALKPGQMAAAIEAIPTGGSAVIESKNITANDTYTAPTGVDGYNPVTVNVPNSYAASDEGKVVQSGALVAQTTRTVTANGTYDTITNNSVVVDVEGGGGSYPIDPTYLPQSQSSNILMSSPFPSSFVVPVDGLITNTGSDLCNLPYGVRAKTDLSGVSSDVTCYCVGRRVGTRSGEGFLFCVPYSMSNSNAPLFDVTNNSGNVVYSCFSGNVTVPNSPGLTNHVYAISVDGTNKKARFFFDGSFLGEKSFSNSGAYVCFGGGQIGSSSYDSDFQIDYGGVVSEFEDDSTVVSNMQTIMSKMGLI